MALGSGLAAQVGIGEEVTYNVGVVPTYFPDFESETVKYRKNVKQGGGIVAGRQFAPGKRHVVTSSDAGGDLVMDQSTRGTGKFLKNLFGGWTSVQNATSGVWDHTFTPAANTGLSLTYQKGVAQTNGTITPYTYTGGKVTQWKLGAAMQDILKSTWSLDFANRVTTTALAAASYADSGVWHFAQSGLTVNGTSYASVRSADLTVSGGNKLDRYYMGNAGMKAEQIRGALMTATGTLTADFSDLTLSTAFHDDAEVALVLQWINPTQIGSTGFYETLTITMPGIRLQGDEPSIASVDITQLSVGFDALVPAAGGTPITVVLRNQDTAP